MKNPIFKIEKLKYDREEKSVLDIKKLEIHRGSCYVIYGDVGSGKSTFLNLLHKDLPYSNNAILYESKDLKKLSNSKYSQDIYFISQRLSIPWFKISVKDYLYKKIKSYKHLTNPDKQLNYIIRTMKLKKYLDSDFRKLSDGEQRWVEIAGAIACDTKILLIDGFGQYLGSEKINILSRILYKKINYDGVTVIVATHVRERLSKIASVFIRLDYGKIVSVRSSHKKSFQKKKTYRDKK